MTTLRKGLGMTVVSILLALAFLGAGAMKLAGGPAEMQAFEALGYPGWFMYVTGLVEVIGAVLLLFPAVRFYGAVLIVCTMLGAIATHVMAGEYGMLGVPVMLLVLAGIVAWSHSPWVDSSTEAVGEEHQRDEPSEESGTAASGGD